MISNQYFIIGCFDNSDRPNAEILYSDKNLKEAKKVLALINDFQIKEEELPKDKDHEKIREILEDEHGVNTYDLDIASVDMRIFHSTEVK